MRMFFLFLAWEWINIALEYTAIAWTKLPRLLLAVVGVNFITHPAFTLLVELFGDKIGFIIACEVVIFLIEWGLLTVFYGFGRWRFLMFVSFTMNAISCCTGLLI